MQQPQPWADTGTSTGRLMPAALGGLADVARHLIRTPTAEGGSRATAQGKHMGTPFPDTGPTERGHQTARAGSYARRTRPQLQCKQSHDFSARMTRTQLEMLRLADRSRDGSVERWPDNWRTGESLVRRGLLREGLKPDHRPGVTSPATAV